MESPRATSRRRARLWIWLTIALAILVAGFSCISHTMLGSFSVADPERRVGYRTAAWVYIALIALSIVAAIVATSVLVRDRRRTDSAASR